MTRSTTGPKRSSPAPGSPRRRIARHRPECRPGKNRDGSASAPSHPLTLVRRIQPNGRHEDQTVWPKRDRLCGSTANPGAVSNPLPGGRADCQPLSGRAKPDPRPQHRRTGPIPRPGRQPDLAARRMAVPSRQHHAGESTGPHRTAVPRYGHDAADPTEDLGHDRPQGPLRCPADRPPFMQTRSLRPARPGPPPIRQQREEPRQAAPAISRHRDRAAHAPRCLGRHIQHGHRTDAPETDPTS